jgi:malate dehydrogenase (oxaloacetate-decarboxylating)
VLAGLINTLKLKGNAALANQNIVISGAGAAAIAIGKLLHQAGATNIIFIDSKGVISSAREDLNDFKRELLSLNRGDMQGNLQDALS